MPLSLPEKAPEMADIAREEMLQPREPELRYRITIENTKSRGKFVPLIKRRKVEQNPR